MRNKLDLDGTLEQMQKWQILLYARSIQGVPDYEKYQKTIGKRNVFLVEKMDVLKTLSIHPKNQHFSDALKSR